MCVVTSYDIKFNVTTPEEVIYYEKIYWDGSIFDNIIKTDANGNTGAYPAKAKTGGISKQREEPFDRFLKHR